MISMVKNITITYLEENDPSHIQVILEPYHAHMEIVCHENLKATIYERFLI
jgi:hypothetical protein